MQAGPRVAVVLPCFRSAAHVLGVIAAIGPEVQTIYAVDDACPEGTGRLIEEAALDARVRVVRRRTNGGVGAAVMDGYAAAFADGADIVVKVDSDGQMDPALLGAFVSPLADGLADYAKGNRFFDPADVRAMPVARIVGNAGLSFLSKLSTGYWRLFDPTNGYTALHRAAYDRLPLERIARRYFFESDMLFRLGLARAVVVDVPMRARYAEEVSGLHAGASVLPFAWRHLRNLTKRVFYAYFLRDLSLASLQLLFGTALMTFSLVFGSAAWARSSASGVPATAGTVMLFGLAALAGLNLLLGFVAYDYQAEPRVPLQKLSAGRGS